MRVGRVDRRAFLAMLASAAPGACAAPRAQGQPPSTSSIGVAIAHVRRDADAALEARGALTPDTVVEVASLSKPLFACAVVTEAVRGAIDLDAPLSKLAPPPYLHARRGAADRFDDPALASVTPRLLLAHRAGLPNWARDRPLAFATPPGTAWSYSGEGYVLLQRAIEAREPLDAFVRRALALPMPRTSFTPRPHAPGHDRAGAEVSTTLAAPLAATSLLSTAADYARFARRLLTPDAVTRTMLTPQASIDRDRRLAFGVGLALAEPEWFFHWGANPGYRSLLVGSQARGEAILVLTDSDAGMEIAAGIVRARFGDLPLLGFPMLYPND